MKSQTEQSGPVEERQGHQLQQHLFDGNLHDALERWMYLHFARQLAHRDVSNKSFAALLVGAAAGVVLIEHICSTAK